MKYSRLSLAIGLCAAATSAVAAPQAFNTSRSFAMGGTGVAVAHPATANSANPAMLAAEHHGWSNDFGIIIPSVNARYADEEEVIDQIDDIQDTLDEYNDLANELANGGGSAEEAQASAQTLHNQLSDLDRDTMRVDAAAGISLAIPHPRIAVGVFTNASLQATARGNVSDVDLDRLQQVIDGNPPASLDDNLESSGHVLASAVIEAGVSLGRSFDLGLENPVQLGIAPKYVQLRTYQYTQMIDDFEEDSFDDGDYETSKSGFNVDLGAAYAFGEERQWNAAVALKNLIPMELDSSYDLARGEQERTLELDPKVTVGIAHTGDYHVLTAEAELTRQKAFGYEDDTQWVAVGAEFDAFRFAQLRVGARQNLASNDDNNGIEEKTQFTAGIGLSPFGARLDIAGLVSNADVGAAVEFGIAF